MTCLLKCQTIGVSIAAVPVTGTTAATATATATTTTTATTTPTRFGAKALLQKRLALSDAESKKVVVGIPTFFFFCYRGHKHPKFS